MFLKNLDETITVGGFQQVDHLVDDDVFEEVLRLLHQLGVQPDTTFAVVAAPPLRFHPLQEIPGDFHLELGFPLFDERGYDLVQ